jgi:hypothetical protein
MADGCAGERAKFSGIEIAGAYSGRPELNNYNKHPEVINFHPARRSAMIFCPGTPAS